MKVTLLTVGKTNDLDRRLSEHIREAKSLKYEHFPKNRWILKTLKNGGKISYKIIEVVNIDNWQDREIFWIDYYRKKGNNLNLSRGGETSSEHFFVNYSDCKKWVKANVDTRVINNGAKWKEYAKGGNLPFFIPHNPSMCYRGEKFSWYDFLGKNETNFHLLKKDYMSYEELCSFITANNIKSISELNKKIKNEGILNIPRDTVRYYKKKGKNILNVFNKFFSFSEFVDYIKVNYPDLNSAAQYYKKHKEMDSRAPFYFKEVYFGEKGLDTLFHDKFITYDTCQKIAVENSITRPKDYYEFARQRKDLNMPSHPDIIFKGKGWKDWESFLCCRNKKMRKNCDFNVFCRYMKIFHPEVKTSTAYKQMMKEKNVSRRIPFRPDSKYKCQWHVIFESIEKL